MRGLTMASVSTEQHSLPVIRESEQKVYRSVECLLAAAKAAKITGEGYVKVSLNQGGVVGAKWSLEQSP